MKLRFFELLLFLGVILILIIGGFLFGDWRSKETVEKTNEKVEKVEETPEVVINNPHEDLIQVNFPTAGATIQSPLTVSGIARGPWYFEATFPLVLVNWDGVIIAEGYATAFGEWMTTDFVPFSGTLQFVKPENVGDWSKRGTLIIKNSNASGLPEHDKALEISVLFE